MRNLAAGLVALAMSSMAAAGPTLECVRGSAGDGIYGFTFAVHGNDGQQKSFFVEMTYEGVQGGLIQQVLAFGKPRWTKKLTLSSTMAHPRLTTRWIWTAGSWTRSTSMC